VKILGQERGIGLGQSGRVENLVDRAEGKQDDQQEPRNMRQNAIDDAHRVILSMKSCRSSPLADFVRLISMAGV
jgi:hypothetical protein